MIVNHQHLPVDGFFTGSQGAGENPALTCIYSKYLGVKLMFKLFLVVFIIMILIVLFDYVCCIFTIHKQKKQIHDMKLKMQYVFETLTKEGINITV